MIRRAVRLGLAWIALVGAAPAPVPVELPLPDLTPLVAVAPAPIDKPPLALPDVVMPAPPAEAAPELPPAPGGSDTSIRTPTAPVGEVSCGGPGDFLGGLFSSTSVALRCGRARFLAERYELAIRDLERAAGEREAGYWAAESLLRLDRVSEADRAFVEVARGPRDALTAYAVHGSGWTALRLGDTARALEAFDGILRPGGTTTPPIVASARRGRALALSLMGRHAEARQAWVAVLDGAPPTPVAREATFWLGDALGRLGQYDAADAQLTRFTGGGGHPLLGAGLLRLGWWRNAAGKPAEALRAYRELLAAPVQGPDLELAYYGIVEAALGAGDVTSAREAIRSLEQRSSRFARPALYSLVRWAAAKRPDEARRLNQDLLGKPLQPAQRAFVLCLEGEVLRGEGKPDDARTRYDLARKVDPSSPIGRYARFRLGQINFDFREFALARDDLRQLLAEPIGSDLRPAVLLLAGEAAYYHGDHESAAEAFRRFLKEFPNHSQAAAAELSAGWAELRAGKDAEARAVFADFARGRSQSPLAPDALVLAAELAASAGDVTSALDLLGQIDDRYPDHPRGDLALLNRAILLLRSGRPQDAAAPLNEYIARAPDSPQVGRARTALGVALLQTRRYQEAQRQFVEARNAGAGAVAALGLGMTSVALRQWEPAAEALGEARDTGTAAVGQYAEYGLAAVAFARGQREEFARLAGRVSQDGAQPALLYALVTVNAEQKAWPEALEAAKRLVETHPSDRAADSALARVGLAAAEDRQWPIAREALSLLTTRYRESPFLAPALFPLAEAHVETGDLAGARPALEEYVKAAGNDPRLPQAWFLLARAREEAGDRPGAIEAYARSQGAPGWTSEVQLKFARLLVAEKRWKDARPALDALMKNGEPATMAEAAYYQGQSHEADGNPAAAVRYYMTAAYVAPESPFGRHALLAAGASYLALKQPDNAAIAYTKLLAQSGLPADLAQRAREALAKLANR